MPIFRALRRIFYGGLRGERARSARRLCEVCAEIFVGLGGDHVVISAFVIVKWGIIVTIPTIIIIIGALCVCLSAIKNNRRLSVILKWRGAFLIW